MRTKVAPVVDNDSASPANLYGVGLEMRTFTDAEAGDIQELFEVRINTMLERHASWFAHVGGISASSRYQKVQRVGGIIKALKQMVKELAENVAMHAKGLGYLMVELDFQRGFLIYIGDTGIGLAKGIRAGYKLKISNDKQAVGLILQLHSKARLRRQFLGSFPSGGRGYERIRLILSELGGSISVRSGRAIAKYAPDSECKPTSVDDHLFPIQGTHTHVIIPRG